jgi:hypothetical protein
MRNSIGKKRKKSEGVCLLRILNSHRVPTLFLFLVNQLIAAPFQEHNPDGLGLISLVEEYTETNVGR